MISDMNVDILWAKPFKIKVKKKNNIECAVMCQFVLIALKYDCVFNTLTCQALIFID